MSTSHSGFFQGRGVYMVSPRPGHTVNKIDKLVWLCEMCAVREILIDLFL